MAERKEGFDFREDADRETARSLGSHISVLETRQERTIVKATQTLVQTNALTIEDDVFGQFFTEDQKPGLIRPTYDPIQLAWLNQHNNTLNQCVSAYEVNIDGTGYEIEPGEELKEKKDKEKKEEQAVADEEKAAADLKAKEGDKKKLEDTLKRKKDKFDKAPKDENGLAIVDPSEPPDIEDVMDADGDGIPDDEEEEEIEEKDPEIRAAEAFFDQVWPGMSFSTLRRLVRRDLEIQGNGYIEVIRNPQTQEILFMNYLDAKLVRLVKLDAPVATVKRVTRNGVEVEVTVVESHRRFAQYINSRLMYFKAFGVTRQLNKFTGEWGPQVDKPIKPVKVVPPKEGEAKAGAKTEEDVKKFVFPAATGPESNLPSEAVIAPGQQIPPEFLATEVLHFTVHMDVTTPYGVPRWINQVPSVLGSRKAEELNLEFFDSGGVPPVMILIQGGELSSSARAKLTDYLAGKAKYKQRGVIAEVYSTSGDLNSAGSVKVSVERFGAERQQDSMFEKYDEKCSERVRQSFRLPPLFVGRTADYNRATSYVSYMTAEAQVFRPERDEFDAVINITLMPEIAPGYVIRSLPVGINDVEEQLKAFQLVQADVSNVERVAAVNEIAHLNLPIPAKKKDVPPIGAAPFGGGADGAAPFGPAAGKGKAAFVEGLPTPGNAKGGDKGKDEKFAKATEGIIAKMDDDVLIDLANDWIALHTGERQFTDESVLVMKTLINVLGPAPRKLFNGYVGAVLSPKAHDPEGVAALFDCALHDHK